MKVVDASALVDLLIRSPRGARVRAALAEDTISAPELVDVEVLSACARLVRANVLTGSTATQAIYLLRQMPLNRISHDHLSVRAWALRDRARISDAFYVACAELLNGTLVTTDGPLSRAPLPGLSILLIN